MRSIAPIKDAGSQSGPVAESPTGGKSAATTSAVNEIANGASDSLRGRAALMIPAINITNVHK